MRGGYDATDPEERHDVVWASKHYRARDYAGRPAAFRACVPRGNYTFVFADREADGGEWLATRTRVPSGARPLVGGVGKNALREGRQNISAVDAAVSTNSSAVGATWATTCSAVGAALGTTSPAVEATSATTSFAVVTVMPWTQLPPRPCLPWT